MKKQWTSPRILVQEFEANEYVAVCWGVGCSTDRANEYEISIGKYDSIHLNHNPANCGLINNQFLQDFDDDGRVDQMTEIGTAGLKKLKCTVYTDGTYTTTKDISDVHPGDDIFWTTSAGDRVWHHQGKAEATNAAHPNRS